MRSAATSTSAASLEEEHPAISTPAAADTLRFTTPTLSALLLAISAVETGNNLCWTHCQGRKQVEPQHLVGSVVTLADSAECTIDEECRGALPAQWHLNPGHSKLESAGKKCEGLSRSQHASNFG